MYLINNYNVHVSHYWIFIWHDNVLVIWGKSWWGNHTVLILFDYNLLRGTSDLGITVFTKSQFNIKPTLSEFQYT